jgi:hypothetical protein
LEPVRVVIKNHVHPAEPLRQRKMTGCLAT